MYLHFRMHEGSAWFYIDFFFPWLSATFLFYNFNLVQLTNLNFQCSSIHQLLHLRCSVFLSLSHHFMTKKERSPWRTWRTLLAPCRAGEGYFGMQEYSKQRLKWTETVTTHSHARDLLQIWLAQNKHCKTSARTRAPILFDSSLAQWTKVFWMNTSPPPKWSPSEVWAPRTKLINWKINDCLKLIGKGVLQRLYSGRLSEMMSCLEILRGCSAY